VANYDLSLWPSHARLRDDGGQLSPSQAWSLSAHQIKVLPLTKDETEPMLLTEGGKPVKIKVHSRQSAAALGLVEITDPAVAPMSPLLAASVKRPTPPIQPPAPWPFSLSRRNGGARGKPRNHVGIGASRSCIPPARFPIDSTGWGSPVIAPEGIIGIVTSEHSMISITEAAKALNFSLGAGGETSK